MLAVLFEKTLQSGQWTGVAIRCDSVCGLSVLQFMCELVVRPICRLMGFLFMSIRLALSTTACPDWTLSQVITQAKAMGYQGVDLATRFGRNTPEFVCDPQQGDAGQIKDELAQAGIEPVCLTTNISFASAKKEDGQAAMAMTRQAADRAAAIGAPAIRVLAYEAPHGEHPHNVMARVAKRISEVVDYAGQQGVQILFENLGSYRTARNWWWCLESVRHPMVGLSWNPASALVEGEWPAVSVPMLNSRIRLVRLTDIRVGPPVQPVQLGEGELEIPKLLRRLMGVGFDGYVVVEWDRLHRPALASAESILPEARTRLTGWLTEIIEAGQPKKVVKKAVPAKGDAAAAKVPMDDDAKAKAKADALTKAAAIKAAKAKAAAEADTAVEANVESVTPPAALGSDKSDTAVGDSSTSADAAAGDTTKSA